MAKDDRIQTRITQEKKVFFEEYCKYNRISQSLVIELLIDMLPIVDLDLSYKTKYGYNLKDLKVLSENADLLNFNKRKIKYDSGKGMFINFVFSSIDYQISNGVDFPNILILVENLYNRAMIYDKYKDWSFLKNFDVDDYIYIKSYLIKNILQECLTEFQEIYSSFKRYKKQIKNANKWRIEFTKK